MLLLIELGIDETIQNKIVTNVLPKEENDNLEDKTEKNIISESIMEKATETVEDVSNGLTVKIIQIGTMISLFIVARIVLSILSVLSSIIDKIPVIKQFNKLGGTIYGFLKGVLIVLIAFAIISIVGPITSIKLIETVNDSNIGKIVYNNNILLKII